MKLKIKKLNSMIEHLSSKEIDLILYLVKRQNDIGAVRGVECNDVMEATGMARSTFYTVMNSLEEKNFIHSSASNKDKGFNLFVHDNSFIRRFEDFKQGYVNINYDFIAGVEFSKLNVNIKKFFMRLLGLKAHIQSVKLLKDTVKRYNVFNKMDELKELFDIEEVDGGYMFKIKESVLENLPNERGIVTIGKKYSSGHLAYKQKVIAYCRNYNIEYTKQELVDTYKTISNHMKKGRSVFVAKAFDVILKKRRLQPKLISYLCGMAY